MEKPLNVEKPKNMKEGHKDIRETLQLREDISVMNVGEDSLKTQASLDVKESTLEKDPIHVTCVAKPTSRAHSLLTIRDYITG